MAHVAHGSPPFTARSSPPPPEPPSLTAGGVVSVPSSSTDPDKKQKGEIHGVDMGNVSVPHFGVHLDTGTFENLKKKLIENNVEFVNEPYIRFKNEELEPETMFIEDPHGNMLEIKTMINPDLLFDPR